MALPCTDPTTCYNPTACTGLSSYYAIDITDAENPKFLWEFSHPLLGYSYSGPAVINRNGKYYVMFLNGPTNPTDGSSMLDVSAFVLSLDSNLGINKVYANDFGATSPVQISGSGFGGRLFTTGLTLQGDTSTDYVFFGYGYQTSAQGWKGGVGVVNTNNSDPSLATDPAHWTWDVSHFSNIAQLPITSQIQTMKCFNQYFLFGGTGRYFFQGDNYGPSGSSGINYIFGAPFQCDQYFNCVSKPNINSLNFNTKSCSGLQGGASSGDYKNAGWQYPLNSDDSTNNFLKERMTTDPALGPDGSNTVYFVTQAPTSDACGYGGESRVWGMNCGTGGAITDTSCVGFTASSTATLYLQTSTGAINQIGSFTDPTTGGRATGFFTGIPPENAPPVVSPVNPGPPGKGSIIHWIEK